jgi:hypothetical protein
MILENFEVTHVKNTSRSWPGNETFGEVDCVSFSEGVRKFFKRPQERRTVVRKAVYNCWPSVYWIFVDTGEWTPGYQMEALWRSYRAKKSLAAAAGREVE